MPNRQVASTSLLVELGEIEVWDHPGIAALESALAGLDDQGAVRVSLDRPLAEGVVTVLAEAFARRPELMLNLTAELRHPEGISLECLRAFPHLRRLRVGVRDVIDFSPIGELHELRALHIGETRRKSLSLAFLWSTPLLEELWLGGQGGREFEAVAELECLRILRLWAPRTKTLDPLNGHPTLAGFGMTLGGIRDLTPLATLPNLRALTLWGIRLLDTDDLAAVGECGNLGGLSLGGLRNVRNLAALARKPAETLRFLPLDRMTGLETLAHLAGCKRLEEVWLIDSDPSDRKLAALASAPALTHFLSDGAYPKAEVGAALKTFHGQCFICGGKQWVGDSTTPAPRVRWRMRPDELLAILPEGDGARGVTQEPPLR